MRDLNWRLSRRSTLQVRSRSTRAFIAASTSIPAPGELLLFLAGDFVLHRCHQPCCRARTVPPPAAQELLYACIRHPWIQQLRSVGLEEDATGRTRIQQHRACELLLLMLAISFHSLASPRSPGRCDGKGLTREREGDRRKHIELPTGDKEKRGCDPPLLIRFLFVFSLLRRIHVQVLLLLNISSDPPPSKPPAVIPPDGGRPSGRAPCCGEPATTSSPSLISFPALCLRSSGEPMRSSLRWRG